MQMWIQKLEAVCFATIIRCKWQVRKSPPFLNLLLSLVDH